MGPRPAMLSRHNAIATCVLAFALPAFTQPPTPAPAKLIVRDAPLSTQMRSDIIFAMMQEIAEDGSITGRPEIQAAALTSTVTYLKLAPTGPSAMLVEPAPDGDLYGPTNTHPLCLFQLTGGRAILILSADAISLNLLPTTHHGMRDVSLVTTLIHTPQEDIQVDQYDGKSYAPAYCYESTGGDGDSKSDNKPKDDDNPKNVKWTDGPHHPC